jgi:hypothetical protein
MQRCGRVDLAGIGAAPDFEAVCVTHAAKFAKQIVAAVQSANMLDVSAQQAFIVGHGFLCVLCCRRCLHSARSISTNAALAIWRFNQSNPPMGSND